MLRKRREKNLHRDILSHLGNIFIGSLHWEGGARNEMKEKL